MANKEKKQNHVFRDFGGVNTKAARTAISDSDFAWIENMMPAGHGNLLSVPGPVLLQSIPTFGYHAYKIQCCNVGNVDYVLVFGDATIPGTQVIFSIRVSDGDLRQMTNPTDLSGYGASMAQWKNERVIVADPVSGLFDWPGGAAFANNMSSTFSFTGKIDNGSGGAGTTLTLFAAPPSPLYVGQLIAGAGVSAGTYVTDNGGSPYFGPFIVSNSQNVAAETLTASSSGPTSGTAVAVYAGRLWVAQGRTIFFSAPDQYADFTTTSYGGSFVMTDPTLHSDITQLFAANGYLYVIGEDSVNVISDVRVAGTPATTVFSNQNLVTMTGTLSPSSVVAFYRTIWMATNYGFYGITGSTSKKGSEAIDGIFPLFSTVQPISAGEAVVNGVLCLCFLAQYNDPVGGIRPLLVVFFEGKWFFSSTVGTSFTPSFIASGTVLGTPTLFAMDGVNVYTMFASAAVALTQTVKTKLWDFDDPLTTKQVLKIGIEVSQPVAPQSVSLFVDSELVSYVSPQSTLSSVQWVNGLFSAVSWYNAGSILVAWNGTGYAWYRGDASNFGKYIGLTYLGAAAGFSISSFQVQYELRDRWG